jgi:hypothetical protein
MAIYERKFRKGHKTVYSTIEKYPTAELGRWKQNKKLDMQDKRVREIHYRSKQTRSKLNRIVTHYNVNYKDGNKMSVKLLSNSNRLPKKYQKIKGGYMARKSKYYDNWYRG